MRGEIFSDGFPIVCGGYSNSVSRGSPSPLCFYYNPSDDVWAPTGAMDREKGNAAYGESIKLISNLRAPKIPPLFQEPAPYTAYQWLEVPGMNLSMTLLKLLWTAYPSSLMRVVIQ